MPDRKRNTVPIAIEAPVGRTGERVARIIPFPRNRTMLLGRLIGVTDDLLSSASLGVSPEEAKFLHCCYDHDRYRFQIDEFSYVEVTEQEDLYRFVSTPGDRAGIDHRCSDIETMSGLIVEYILARVEEERRRRLLS